ncbi:MAG: rhodanese-like domain-containing protein [Actinomycetota bacterium]
MSATPAAPADEAARHFAARARFETDCADVWMDLAGGVAKFVVVDARSEREYAAGHIPGARSLPHCTISVETTAWIPRDAVVVTYCAGPHCNAATHAAAKLAALGHAVKEMLGGIAGWRAEGYALSPNIRE